MSGSTDGRSARARTDRCHVIEVGAGRLRTGLSVSAMAGTEVWMELGGEKGRRWRWSQPWRWRHQHGAWALCATLRSMDWPNASYPSS